MRSLPVEVLVVTMAMALPGQLLADKGDKGKGHKPKKDAAVAVSVSFTADQRDHVRGYFVKKHGRGNCPPGLAKKNSQCLPPGQLKKRYIVGQPLPREIEMVEVPHDLVVSLGPPPSGYRYCMVDGDFVQVTISTRVVVDFIDGLVD
jgi:Ni/Co efflux regulator RcnB